MSRPKVLIAKAKELGYSAIALTDHANVHNLVRVQAECQKAGIKLIPGCEIYFTLDHAVKEDRSYHLTLLAQDNLGLSNLYKMLTWANIPVDQHKHGGFHGRPRTSWSELELYSKGLICLTGCMSSIVNQAFLKDGYDGGRTVALRLLDIFGSKRLIVELQNTNEGEIKYIPEHDELLAHGRQLAKDLNLLSVATNDSHYISRDDEEAHEVLKCISTGAKLYDPVAQEGVVGGRIKFRGHSYHLQSYEEMLKTFTKEEVENSVKVANLVKVEVPLKGNHMPKFNASLSSEQAFAMLTEKVEEGWIFWKIDQKQNGDEYRRRLHIEMADIEEAGLTDYFLIVWDVTKFIEDKKIGRGFSRGSAGGSLVSFLLHITLVDPIEHGLIWERFWNRGRKGSMPDIDMDVDPDRRDEVVEYLRNKFGRNRVFPMMTISKMTAKVVVKDVGRAVGLPYHYLNELCKHFPHKCKSIDDAVARSKEIESAAKGDDEEVRNWKSEIDNLRKLWKDEKRAGNRDFQIEGRVVDLNNNIAERSKKLLKTFRVARKLENVARQRGRHACAILISDKAVFGNIPLTWDTKHKTLITGWDMYDLDKLGYLKLDVLGLANCAVVARILKNGVYDVIAEGFDNPSVFELIGSGNCKGIFQLESHLGRQWSRKMKPKNLEELAALISILRPAVLETGLAAKYLENRATGKWQLIHKGLRQIFNKTYGIMLYQEQMLEVVKQFGGFDLAHADQVRKAAGKKLPEEMAKHEKDFLEGCAQNQHDKELAKKLWEWIVAGADYGFNASHAFGYACMTYTTAWLKRHRTLDFFKVLLQMSSFAPSPKEEIAEIFYDAKLFGIKVRGPSAELGNDDFEAHEGEIYFGLKHVRGIGDATAVQLKDLKNLSWGEVVFREQRIKRPALKALIYSGAFDYLHVPRLQLDYSVVFADKLTDREVLIMKSLLTDGAAVQLGKSKMVRLGKRESFRSAVEALLEFLQGENKELKAINKNRADKIELICSEFLERDENEEVNQRTKAGYETYYLGIPATCSEVDAYNDPRRTHTCIKVKKASEGSEICTIGVVMDINRRKTRKGTDMAFIKLADQTYMIEGLAFSQELDKIGAKLKAGGVILVNGEKKKGALIINKMEAL